MKPSELRIQLRAALSDCRKYRGDPQEHLKACFDEVMQEPVKEWPWYIKYFQAQADQCKPPSRKVETQRPAPIVDEPCLRTMTTDAARYAAPEA